MVDPELLKVLACPQTRQPLVPADEEVLARINEAIRRGEAVNCGGDRLTEALEAGLMTQDRRYLYPIINGIPVLLRSEAVDLSLFGG